MTQPINQTQSSTYDPSTHYDAEAGMCVAPAASGSAPPADVPAAVERDQGSRAAVDQLVRSVESSKDKSCTLEVVGASLNCLTMGLSIASAPVTGPLGIALAVSRGASCGFGVMVAVDCLE